MPYIKAMSQPLNTVAYTQAFLSQAKEEGMTEEEILAVETLLSANPSAGTLIVGSGGCRKVRIAGRGKGKSGGYRVVTFFAQRAMPVYLIAVLSKGSRENFTEGEVAAMAVFAKRTLAALTPRAVS
jgi:hypothetical protein